MAKRKEFKTIADGLIGSFVSRNNDVYGYWGIGKLFSHMTATGSMKLRIDFVHRTIEPENEEFKVLIDKFAKRLIVQLEKRRLNPKWLKKAELTMIGYPNELSPNLGRRAPNKINCKLVILDDQNKAHSSEANTWCREHNPNRESKSTREYESNRKRSKSE